MRIIDLKGQRRLVVLERVRAKNAFGFKFFIYKYRNVIGISSKVYKDWHVVFGDYDKSRINSKLVEKVMHENNMCVLLFLESSKGKYHFISPQCYDWFRALSISRELGAEQNYLSLSALRGEFILRISRKGSKPVPRVVKIFQNEYAHNVLLNKPHLNFLRIYHKVEIPIAHAQLIGKRLKVERYRTTNV